jgi:hypothetical protein
VKEGKTRARRRLPGIRSKGLIKLDNRYSYTASIDVDWFVSVSRAEQ